MTDCEELLFDADVMIDFCRVDRAIIGRISDGIGRAHVSSVAFGEVDNLTRPQCERLNLTIESPTLSELDDAGNVADALSFSDRLTMVMARQRGWVCVTNDRKLRRCCALREIETRRGLILLVEAVRIGAMKRGEAKNLARAIGAVNNIEPGVIDRIVDMIDRAR